MSYNYTIIIPHHNIPNLLDRCLSSIPIRSDLQIIVVDDNSSTQYKEQMKKLELKYPYVEFIYNSQNGGGGRARNTGLIKAKGKFLLFADSDDFFNPCLNEILNDYSNKDYDLVLFAANSLDSVTYQNSDRSDVYNRMINNHEKVNDIDLRYKHGMPWGKIISRKLVEDNNIRFQETIRHNDVGFTYLVSFYANQIMVDRRAIYCITTREGSVSTNVSIEALLTGVRVFVGKYLFLKDHGVDIGYPKYISNSLYMLRMNKNDFKRCLQVANEMGLDYKVIKNEYYKWLIKRYINKYILFRKI